MNKNREKAQINKNKDEKQVVTIDAMQSRRWLENALKTYIQRLESKEEMNTCLNAYNLPQLNLN